LKQKYKFRLLLDETWSYGVLGRTGRGITEHQNVDVNLVDMIVGSLAGPLCAGGGFCASSEVAVEHQRISSLSYTYSAALPAMLATTASETITLIQTNPEILAQCRESVKLMWAQLDPRSEWVYCTSAIENPMMLLQFKPEVVSARKWGIEEQEHILQEIVDEVNIYSFVLRVC
jgi:7-keto-8-aminopelargonate synthetase-like enzyme